MQLFPGDSQQTYSAPSHTESQEQDGDNVTT